MSRILSLRLIHAMHALTSKYHLLCVATIIEVKVMSGHQVKKVKQKKIVI